MKEFHRILYFEPEAHDLSELQFSGYFFTSRSGITFVHQKCTSRSTFINSSTETRFLISSCAFDCRSLISVILIQLTTIIFFSYLSLLILGCNKTSQHIYRRISLSIQLRKCGIVEIVATLATVATQSDLSSKKGGVEANHSDTSAHFTFICAFLVPI